MWFEPSSLLSSLYGVRHDDTTYTHCRAAHHAFEYGLAHSPGGRGGHHDADAERHKQSPRIKKPLNAFMLFMKEMRPKVIEECSLKESAAINQILGRKVSACVLPLQERRRAAADAGDDVMA